MYIYKQWFPPHCKPRDIHTMEDPCLSEIAVICCESFSGSKIKQVICQECKQWKHKLLGHMCGIPDFQLSQMIQRTPTASIPVSTENV